VNGPGGTDGGLGFGLTVGITALGLLASAFFSGSETGYMTASRIRLRLLADTAHRRVQLLRHHLRDIEDPIMTCLIGTNLAGVLISAILTAALTARFGASGSGLAMVVSSGLIITFGEILPKLLYREFPERMMIVSVPVLELFRCFFAITEQDDPAQARRKIAGTLVLLLLVNGCQQTSGPEMISQPGVTRYEPAWESLKQHETPQWLRDAKFGKSRLVPLHCSTRQVLTDYLTRRGRFLAGRSASCLFITGRRNRLDGGDVRRTFYAGQLPGKCFLCRSLPATRRTREVSSAKKEAVRHEQPPASKNTRRPERGHATGFAAN